MAGLKRLFSLRTTYDAAKSVCKVALLAGVLYMTPSAALLLLSALGERTPFEALEALAMLASLALKWPPRGLAARPAGHGSRATSSAQDAHEQARREGRGQEQGRRSARPFAAEVAARIEMLRKAASVRADRPGRRADRQSHAHRRGAAIRGEMAAPVMLARARPAGGAHARSRGCARRGGDRGQVIPAGARPCIFKGKWGRRFR